MNINSIKGFFVCQKCRIKCKDGSDKIGLYGPNSCVFAYFPRKQYVNCLGPYCDEPCEHRTETSDLTIEQLLNLVKFLTKELNSRLVITDEHETTNPRR